MMVIFKNPTGFTVLRCPKCGKLYLHKYPITEEFQQYNIFKCCECGVKLEYLNIITEKIEIEL